MRLGAIDVGTNSCRMLVADYNKGEIKEIKRNMQITRLGEGVDKNKELTEQAINRALIVISTFVNEMKKINVNKIKINGTSALRDVNNAHKLLDAVKKETGYKLDIISGEEEARLNYIGVASGSECFIIDIGGGSTEFIWFDNDRINYKSLDMGSVRMTERLIYNPQKPVTNGELSAIENDVKELINKNIAGKTSNIEKAIGLGGTITTIAAIDQEMTVYDLDKIQDYILKIETVKTIRDSLSNKTIGQRKKVNGLQAGRADIIIAGIQILYVIMDLLDIKEIQVSEHDLLYGAIKEIGK